MKKTRCLLLVFLTVLVSCGSDALDQDLTDQMNEGEDQLSNRLPVGASSRDLLSAENYTSLRIEILQVGSYTLPQSSEQYLLNFIEQRLHKPLGVSVVRRSIPATNEEALTIAEIDDIEKEYRASYNNGQELAIYFLVADTDYAIPNVLGVAYKNTSMAIFQKRIEELSGGLGQVSTSLLTSTVIAHELGHIMGLVNVGSPMRSPHQDEANGKHCTSASCLMYYSVENASGLEDLLGSSEPPRLDDFCLEDLKANGGK